MNLSLLTAPPSPDQEEIRKLIETVNAALATGLSRLPQDLRDRLTQLGDAFEATPLGPVVTEGIARLLSSEFSTAALVSLAAARSALAGALHDALRQQAIEAIGLLSEEAPESAMIAPGADAPLLAGVQHWLGEVAVAGSGNLDEAQLAPFETILSQLQARPQWSGLAALLTGFVEELTQAAQRQSRQDPPAHRWADLWCAAMLGAQAQMGVPAFSTVTGILHPCGIDLSENRAFVSTTLWGLFVPDDARPRIVRVPFSSWKVSVATGDEIWKLFQPAVQPLLNAIAAGESVRMQGELGAGGDLRITGAPQTCEAANPFDLPQPWIALPAVSAAVRHPVHMVQMIRLDECKVAEGAVVCEGATLPIDSRLFARTDLDSKMMDAATGMIALLRWDAGQWRLQPICLRGKGKLKTVVRAGQGIAARLAKSKSDALATLQERASRLLRTH
ncbi:MAG: hypothetical protein V4710_15185 [Verrucomicrobiota bacterium]